VIWDYKSGFTGTERGVAVAAGRIFAALGGEHVVALNQQTGALIWQTQVGTAGMRGHLYALHAADGTAAWAFATTAGPGQPGHSSWKGTSWKLGGGDVWMAPAIDPKLGTIYLAVANPEPRVSGAVRAGRNLYTNSLVALNWKTGKLRWYFQSVHHYPPHRQRPLRPRGAESRYIRQQDRLALLSERQDRKAGASGA
jgi:glucose dehydrogenase